jgi:response regulator NasT
MITATFGAAGESRRPVAPSRILVADRDRAVTEELTETLESFNLVVTATTASAAQIVQACRGRAPDLALIDLELRTEDGRRAAQIIAQDLGIPVIALSATCAAVDVGAACASSVVGLLLKPVAEAQLRAAVGVAWSSFLASEEQLEEIERLKQRLEDRKAIEQAKWALVQRLGISEPEALRTLQRRARNTRRTLPAVARSILDTTEVIDAVRATG